MKALKHHKETLCRVKAVERALNIMACFAFEVNGVPAN